MPLRPIQKPLLLQVYRLIYIGETARGNRGRPLRCAQAASELRTEITLSQKCNTFLYKPYRLLYISAARSRLLCRFDQYKNRLTAVCIGRSGETRTRGLMVPNHARYQLRYASIWSGKRESNPQPSAWEATALPLSHSRIAYKLYHYLTALSNDFRYSAPTDSSGIISICRRARKRRRRCRPYRNIYIPRAARRI